METLLTRVQTIALNAWQWINHLNGGLQIVLVILACLAAGTCTLIARRAQNPIITPNDTGAGSLLVAILAYIAGAVCTLIMIAGILAVFAPLIGIQA